MFVVMFREKIDFKIKIKKNRKRKEIVFPRCKRKNVKKRIEGQKTRQQKKKSGKEIFHFHEKHKQNKKTVKTPNFLVS